MRRYEIETIHESLVNGQRKQMVEQAVLKLYDKYENVHIPNVKEVKP